MLNFSKKMINASQENLLILTKILNKHLPQDAVVYAFGSRIKGSSRQYSDLDITIKTQDQLPNKIMIEVKDELMESDIPFRVDVSQWNNLSINFKNCIKDELVEIKR